MIFDAAEVDVLRWVKRFMDIAQASMEAITWFAGLRDACTRVQRSRLPRVLSTFINYYGVYSQTLLMYSLHSKDIAEWLLLQVGVCPNMGWYDPMSYPHLYRGWYHGRAHPGRPTQLGQRMVLEFATRFENAHFTKLLLASGACPSTMLWGAAPFLQWFPGCEGHWHRWHARSARRQWLTLA
jgi:hypothetical protein